jgi:hypothetical protein
MRASREKTHDKGLSEPAVIQAFLPVLHSSHPEVQAGMPVSPPTSTLELKPLFRQPAADHLSQHDTYGDQ